MFLKTKGRLCFFLVFSFFFFASVLYWYYVFDEEEKEEEEEEEAEESFSSFIPHMFFEFSVPYLHPHTYSPCFFLKRPKKKKEKKTSFN
jgi:hypothetical protein